jgi:seryl-tRNA synthetase
MHDIKWIRDNPEAFTKAMQRRGFDDSLLQEVLALDAQRRNALTRQQELQKERNELSKKVGIAKRQGEDADALMAQVKAIKQEMEVLDEELNNDSKLNGLLSTLPNILQDAVPKGGDESDNQIVRDWGTKPSQDFTPQEHDDIGITLGGLDFKQAAYSSGARFVYLMNDLARMERALVQMMLNMHTEEFGYMEVIPPFMVHDKVLYGTGQLPKFEEDLFKTTTDHYLIPTSEVPLTNLVADKILDEAELPLRFTAYTPCFRSEAGSAGRDTKGMIRQHQFSKVELVGITTPEQSEEEHQKMLAIAEQVLQRLELHYRVVTLCSGDTGFSAQKTYDLEVWVPSQDTYREISSVSNCGDFQARRMKARCRKAGEKQTRFVHSLNGSALAVGRTIVAILENYQQADGSVTVPKVLQPFMGKKRLVPAAETGLRKAG